MCTACPDKIVCHCLQVTEADLVQVITTLEVRTVREVRHHTGAGAGCMCCHARIRAYIERPRETPQTALAG
jgi:bacterioferritin-associated ferredoxin